MQRGKGGTDRQAEAGGTGVVLCVHVLASQVDTGCHGEVADRALGSGGADSRRGAPGQVQRPRADSAHLERLTYAEPG